MKYLLAIAMIVFLVSCKNTATDPIKEEKTDSDVIKVIKDANKPTVVVKVVDKKVSDKKIADKKETKKVSTGSTKKETKKK